MKWYLPGLLWDTGETYFSDTTTAYAALSEEWKQRLNGLTGLFSFLKYRGGVYNVPGLGSDEDRQTVEQGISHYHIQILSF